MMTVRDLIHALEQMPETHTVKRWHSREGWVPIEECVENINVGGVVIR